MKKTYAAVKAIYRACRTTHYPLPLMQSRVQAGFPSPADDYIEGRLDLNRHLIKHPAATFYVHVTGDSMTGAGIYPGDLLVVDRAMECDDGHIVIARIHDELTVKRLHLDQNGKFWLLAAHDGYQPICIQDEDTEIWGRVMYSIKAL